jgi:hypothetical protein
MEDCDSYFCTPEYTSKNSYYKFIFQKRDYWGESKRKDDLPLWRYLVIATGDGFRPEVPLIRTRGPKCLGSFAFEDGDTHYKSMLRSEDADVVRVILQPESALEDPFAFSGFVLADVDPQAPGSPSRRQFALVGSAFHLVFLTS